MESSGNNPSPSAQSGSIILDNGTARGALIALGIINPPYAMGEPSIKILDSHVACAELLVESILLHDHIYLPRVHTEGYPDVFYRMQSLLGKDLLLELPFEKPDIRNIEQLAEEDFATWPLAEEKLRKRLREFSGIEVPLASWDRWIQARYCAGSGFTTWQDYLHVISDYYVKHLDTASKRLSERFPSNQSEQIDAAVLWLTYRTCVYDWIAWAAGIPYVPHPQRASLWKAINIRRSQPEIFYELPYDVLFDARIAVGTRLNKAAGIQLFDLSIPPFFTYVLSKSKSTLDILNVALEVRSKREVRALRNTLKEISRSLFKRGSVLKIQDLITDFEKLKKELTIEYHIESAPKITPTIQVTGIFGAEFDTKIPVQLVKIAAKFWSLNKPHLAFLRDVFKTTIDVWKLAHEYDRLFLGRRTLLEPSVTPSRVVTSPPDRAVPRASGNWGITVQIEDPEYEAPIECRRKLDEFLSLNPDCNAFLAIIDIDNMDSVYNANGWWVGDRVIYEVALTLKEVGVKLLSKVAGDTFIAIQLNGVATLESDIRVAVGNIPFYLKTSRREPEKKKLPIAVSVGSAISPNDGTSADALLKVAYQRMEEEKSRKKGRG